MTRVGSPGPSLTPGSLPQGAPASALLAEVPPALRNVGLGAFLTGTVIERAANGMTLLQTGAGVLGIKTTVPLPVGSAVTLQVQTAGAQLQAIVLAVTPQALKAGAQPTLATLIPGTTSPAAQPAATPGQTAAPAAAAAAQTPVDARGLPSTITATVIGPPGSPLPSAATAAAPASAPPPQSATGAPPPAAPVQAAPSPAVPTSPPPAAPAASAPGVPVAAQTAAYQRQFDAVPAPATSPSPASAATPPVAIPVAMDGKGAVPTARVEAPPVPLPNGTQVQVRLLPAEAGPAPQTFPTAPPSGATPATQKPSLLPASLAGLLRLPDSSSPAPAPAAPPAATTLAATIVARTPAGQTILDTAMGRLLVPLPRTLESALPGSNILLELLASDLQAASSRPGAAAPAASALAREWPALKEMARLFQQAPTPETQAALDRAIPKPGPRLAQQMMAFVEATAQGGARAWLGDTLGNALQRLAGGMIERLDHDLREMQSQRALESEWRMTVIPMLDGRDLRQIRFFERRRKREEAERKKDESSRFVVECEHSEFGPVQLDGLMHERRMDLIVRTHDALPADMERDILVLFGQSCTGLNLAGQLFFQAVPVFPVNPLDDFTGSGVQVSA